MFRTILALQAFIGVCYSGFSVSFYENPNFSGQQTDMSIDSRECYSFPEAWQNRISSVDTYGGCIYAYDSSDCSGRRIQIGPGTQNHNNLDEINFNNKLRSFIQCPLSNVVVHSESTDVWSVALKEHNKYREIHHSPALRGDSSLNSKAQAFAEYLASNNKFENSNSETIGENIAENSSQDKISAVRGAVKQWYDTMSDYDYNNPGYSNSTSAFTTLVWRNSQRLGVGVAWNRMKRCWVVVANYSPPGNVQGANEKGNFEDNVGRPTS